ncbi:hypothetical protein P879_11571, partial [Paragonimus westermani]
VGCGAIGCELLKNLALLGVATDGDDNTDCRPSINSATSAPTRTNTEGCFLEDSPVCTKVSIPHRPNSPVSNPNSSRSTSSNRLSIIPPVPVHGEAGDVRDQESAPFSSSLVAASSSTTTVSPTNVVESLHGTSELGDHARWQGSDGSLFLPRSRTVDPLNVRLCSSSNFSTSAEHDSVTVQSEGTPILESSLSRSVLPLKEGSTTVAPVEQPRTRTSTEGCKTISETDDSRGSSSVSFRRMLSACYPAPE